MEPTGFSTNSTSQSATRFNKYIDENNTNNDISNDATDNKPSQNWIPNSRFKREQHKLRRQKINIIFNYSKIELTADMENVLNRGLNFSILPLKLDLTQVLVDFHKFERSMIWTEFFYGKEIEYYNPPIFKANKNNLPKNYSSPNELKTFLGAIKSELMDPHNRNKVDCNLPPEEMKAIKQLIELQKERQIVIKPCDKGAGIIILYFEEYMNACMSHLNSIQNNGGEEKPFYKEVDETALENAKFKILKIVQEGFDNEIINVNEYEAMKPEGKGPGR